jgi:NADH dehydrogenase FAD-containing subunit
VKQSRLRRQVVIIGAGFAGYAAARELARLGGRSAEITVINSTDYFLYLPLMPQVTGGLVEPRHVCVPLARKLRGIIPSLTGQPVRWMLLDIASRLLPELDGHLSKTAKRVLRRRGIEVRTSQSVTEAQEDCVQLSTEEKVATYSLI